MNLLKKKGKKTQKVKVQEEPAAEPQQMEMESFDDFLNTLSDSDEDDQAGEDVAQVASEEDEESGSEMIEDEDEEDDDVELQEEATDEEDNQNEEPDDDDDEEDDDSFDLNAELEKSLENEKAHGATEAAAKGNAEIDDDEDDVDYFLRDEEPDDENTKEETAASFKKSLASLEETDPEFFAYLKENDAELLDFGGSDEEDEEGSDEEDEEEEGAVHVPPAELEVASDSEAESEEEQFADKESTEYKSKVANFIQRRIVNLSVVSHWEAQLRTTRDLTIFAQVVDAFDSAVEIVLQDKEAKGGSNTAWKVEGSANFNALVRLCIRHLFSFCTRYICGSNNAAFCAKAFTKTPLEVRKKNDSRWSKLRPKLRAYMNALVQFLRSMGNPDAITSVLRHCQAMAGFWALFTTKAQKLLRTLISIWSSGEDSSRIAAFVTILRMTNYNQDFFLARVLKQMYIAFVSNCKFTTPNSWPAINFMRASLVEIYLLDTKLAYTIAFPFVRQLAIHLRNARNAGNTLQSSGEGGKQQQRRARGVSADGVLGSKSEATRIVYSWQFLHSLHLWAALLGEAGAKGDDSLQLLVHPVVQIAIGTVNLNPTRKYLPLRFHVIRILTELQSKTKIFIPVLPLITSVLNLTDFNQKAAGKFSVRPLNLQICLKADPAEAGYYKAVADSTFDALLAACQAIGTEVAFPEAVTPTLYIIKNFLRKKCKNGEVNRRFKTLIEKIEANSTFISEKRAAAMDAGLVHLGDEKLVQVLQIEIENSNPPIMSFAKEYFKLQSKQMAKLQRASAPGKQYDETREERMIPKPGVAAGAAGAKKRSQGEKKRARMEKVLFAEHDGDEGEDDEDDEMGDESDQEFRTKFDEPEPAPPPTTKETKNKSKKMGKRSTPASVDADEDEDDGQNQQQQPAKKAKKSIKKKKKAKGKMQNKTRDDEGDMPDEVVDFDDFGDSEESE